MEENKDLIIKLALGEKISDKEIENELYEICDRVHSSCDEGCPVYRLNNSKAPGSDKPFSKNRGCDTFKNGAAMRKFIVDKFKK